MSHFKDWTLEQAFVGTPLQVVEKIEPFIKLGVDYFMFEIIGLPDPDVVGMVLPKLRKVT